MHCNYFFLFQVDFSDFENFDDKKSFVSIRRTKFIFDIFVFEIQTF